MLEGDGWEEVMGPVVAPIRQLVENADSLEELQARLGEALGKMGTATVADSLARAMFQARAAGSADRRWRNVTTSGLGGKLSNLALGGIYMGNELEPVTETAEVAKEALRTLQVYEPTLRSLGTSLSEVLCDIPANIIGRAFGDRLLIERGMDWLDRIGPFAERVREICNSRGLKLEDLQRAAPRKLRPLFHAVADESDPDLIEFWATLLANALDPGKRFDLRAVIIKTLREFEPLDACVLLKLAQSKPYQMPVQVLASRIEAPKDLVILSALNLQKLDCVYFPESKANPIEGLPDGILVTLTLLGREIYRAVEPDSTDGPDRA